MEVPTGASSKIGSTPMIEVEVHVDGLSHTLFLKDERRNPTGSVKDRAALAVIEALRTRDGFGSSTNCLIESTSGNMGAALAWQAQRLGLGFIAVVDPNLSKEQEENIRRLGGEIHRVTEPDASGNYLRARLAAAEGLEAAGQGLWTRQYSNSAIVAMHARTTGPEIDAQVNFIDEVYVAVSTCGTLVGIGGYFRSRKPNVRVVAVDVLGSVALCGESHKRYLTGIGAAMRAQFEVSNTFASVATVTERECVDACRLLREQTGIGSGASTGAVVAAFVARARTCGRRLVALAMIADGARNYESTIYNESWPQLALLSSPRDATAFTALEFTVKRPTKSRAVYDGC
jgi:cysteine synthase